MVYDPDPMCLNGMPVYLNDMLTESKLRTWKERLFSLPWRPFKAVDTSPSRQVISTDGKLIMHPALWEDVKQLRNLSQSS